MQHERDTIHRIREAVKTGTLSKSFRVSESFGTGEAAPIVLKRQATDERQVRVAKRLHWISPITSITRWQGWSCIARVREQTHLHQRGTQHRENRVEGVEGGELKGQTELALTEIHHGFPPL
jgi:hypothetical protein